MASSQNEYKRSEFSDILTNEENTIINIKESDDDEKHPISENDPLDVSQADISKAELEDKFNHKNSDQYQALNQNSHDCYSKKTVHIDSKCAVCNKIFKFQQNLIKHAAQYHPKEKALKCNDCSVVSSNLNSLARHASVHLKSFKKALLTKYVCEFCPKTFDYNSRLKYHLKTHSEECPFTCSLCQKGFKYKFSLQKHQRMHCKDEQQLKEYVCEFCSKTFDRLSRLKYHLATHTEEYPYSCQLCPKIFKYKFSLKKHQILSHFKEDPKFNKHVCELCSKLFTCRSDLKRHKMVHTEERPFSCTVCRKKYKHKNTLKKHQRTHFEDEITFKKYVCEFCSKRFYERTDFERHLKVHTGEKPFACSLCEKSFIQKTVLIRHQNIFHSNCKDFKCQHCGLVFTNVKSLKHHKKSHKDLTKKHLCEFCSKVFNNIGNLKSHYSVHSEERPFSCVFCQKGFKHKNDLNTHQKRFHLQQLNNQGENSTNSKSVHKITGETSSGSDPPDGGSGLSISFASNDVSINCVECRNDSEQPEELNINSQLPLNTVECLNEIINLEECCQRNQLNLKINSVETMVLKNTHIKEELHSNSDSDENVPIKNMEITKTEYCMTVAQPFEVNFSAKNCRQRTIFEKTKNHLNNKFKIKHNKEPLKKLLLKDNKKCVVCKKKFKFQLDLVKHVHKFHRKSNVLKSKYMKTLTQSNRTKNNAGYIKKQKIHLNQHGCEFCSKIFDSISSLHCHLNTTHIEERLFGCTLCNKTYKHEKSLRRHQVTHLQEERTYKKNICEFCSKLFSCESDLKRHLRVHTGERPFPCTLCKKAFTQKFNLKAHHINVHLEQKSKHKHHSSSLPELESTSIKTEEKYTDLTEIHTVNIVADPLIATTYNVHCSDINSTELNYAENRCYSDQTSFNDYLGNSENTHNYKEDINTNCDSSQDALDIKNIIEISKTEYIHNESFLKVTDILADISDANIMKAIKTEIHVQNSEEDQTTKEISKTKESPKKCTNKHLNPNSQTHLKQPVCEFCTKTFDCNSRLRHHLKSHSEERDYVCSLCQKRFKYMFSLKKHQRTHFEDEKTLKKHVCGICSKRFYGITDLKRHLRVHTGETPFSCSLCKESFKQKKMLVRHQNIFHSNSKELKCPDCALVFSTSKSLTNHRKSHKDLTKKHLCEFCSKAFHHISNLKSHYSVHSEERPFSCSFCQKSFKLKNDLNTHQKKFHLKILNNHAQETENLKTDPSFESVALEAVEAQSVENLELNGDILNASERLENNTNDVVNQPKLDFRFKDCGLIFTNMKSLAHHGKSHNKFVCAVCCKTFADIHHWKRHLRVHTEERPFSRSLCEKSFKNNYNLSSHQRSHEKQKSKGRDKKYKN